MLASLFQFSLFLYEYLVWQLEMGNFTTHSHHRILPRLGEIEIDTSDYVTIGAIWLTDTSVVQLNNKFVFFYSGKQRRDIF